MSQLLTEGKVMTDLELKWSERSKRHYVYFTLAEQLGYGDRMRYQYYQVWAFGSDAQQLASRNVGKHSRVWIFGSLELVDQTRRDGAKEKGLKLYLASWGFVSEGVPKLTLEMQPPAGTAGALLDSAAQDKTAPIEVIRGDKDTLPE